MLYCVKRNDNYENAYLGSNFSMKAKFDPKISHELLTSQLDFFYLCNCRNVVFPPLNFFAQFVYKRF